MEVTFIELFETIIMKAYSKLIFTLSSVVKW